MGSMSNKEDCLRYSVHNFIPLQSSHRKYYDGAPQLLIIPLLPLDDILKWNGKTLYHILVAAASVARDINPSASGGTGAAAASVATDDDASSAAGAGAAAAVATDDDDDDTSASVGTGAAASAVSDDDASSAGAGVVDFGQDLTVASIYQDILSSFDWEKFDDSTDESTGLCKPTEIRDAFNVLGVFFKALAHTLLLGKPQDLIKQASKRDAFNDGEKISKSKKKQRMKKNKTKNNNRKVGSPQPTLEKVNEEKELHDDPMPRKNQSVLFGIMNHCWRRSWKRGYVCHI